MDDKKCMEIRIPRGIRSYCMINECKKSYTKIQKITELHIWKSRKFHTEVKKFILKEWLFRKSENQKVWQWREKYSKGKMRSRRKAKSETPPLIICFQDLQNRTKARKRSKKEWEEPQSLLPFVEKKRLKSQLWQEPIALCTNKKQ